MGKLFLQGRPDRNEHDRGVINLPLAEVWFSMIIIL